jgi:hypothetical protein
LDVRLWRYPKAREGLFYCLKFLGRVLTLTTKDAASPSNRTEHDNVEADDRR